MISDFLVSFLILTGYYWIPIDFIKIPSNTES